MATSAQKKKAQRRRARAAPGPPPPRPVLAQAPPPARKPRRQRRPRGSMGVSLSPCVPGLVPSLVHQGEAFPICGLSEYEANVGTSWRWAVIFSNVGDAGTIGTAIAWSKAGGTSVATVQQMFTLPLLSEGSPYGPTSSRAMKIGVDVVTNTQLLSRGGPVYYLNSSQRFQLAGLPSTMTATQWNDFYSVVVSHPHRRKFDMNDFAYPQHFYGHVVDDPRYNDFDTFRGTLSFDSFLSHLCVWTGSPPADRPMSTLIFLMETSTAAQLLTFTARASFYTRWPLNTVPGQSQVDIPTATPGVLNGMHKAAVQHARSVVTDYARAAAGAVSRGAVRAMTARFAPAIANIAPALANRRSPLMLTNN